MIISELINGLRKIKKEEGDLKVIYCNQGGMFDLNISDVEILKRGTLKRLEFQCYY